ncbi:MAG: transpeptidase family protein [Alistipes sp.]|jgi:cell division protein FtsI (penicillin-binding protein 3)|nr:transpeptidase family protein [Alistipes sp.]
MSRDNRNHEPDIKREIMLRVKLLYAIFLVVGLCIFGRIMWIQWGPDGAALREKAEERTFRPQRIDGRRGDIRAANGELLATSVLKYYLGMDFRVDSLTADRFHAGVDGLADSLSRLFGDRSKAGYKTLLTDGWNGRSTRGYRRLNPRLISGEELKRVRTFPLLRLRPGFGGISLERVYTREHPFGDLAARTLGITRSVYDTIVTPHKDPAKRRTETMLTERGVYGIEYSFNERLKGEEGWQMMMRLTPDHSQPVENPLNVDPSDGMDVVTTLDMDFQDVASTMLERQLVQHNAIRGTVVLMEVATGEIKAIANLDNVGGRGVERLNYAIGDVDEPGSTFKLATMLALLDDGMRLDSRVEVGGGVMELRGATFRDDHKPEASTATLLEVFETSSNVGFVRAVEDRFSARGRDGELVEYMSELGFDRPLGTGMTGEAVPVFHKPTPGATKSGAWHSNSAAYMSHGYGIEVSPLHILTLYNAVAGGGRMVRPMLVKELRGADGRVERFDTDVINPSITSSRTIEAVRRSLVGVVEDGTAGVLKNPYYKVAAKTGTAQQDTYGGGLGQVYMATMVGYFPADDPKYSCIVSIWTRRGSWSDTFYGSSLAGPVFKAVADRVYVTRYDLQTPVADITPVAARPPEVKGGQMRAVREVAGELGFKVGGDVRRRDMATVRRDSLSAVAVAIPCREGVTPSVVGMGLKDALWAVESLGLRVEFRGSGRVTEQFPEAGTAIRKGATVTLTLQ